MRRPTAVTAAIGLAAVYGAVLVAVAALVLSLPRSRAWISSGWSLPRR